MHKLRPGLTAGLFCASVDERSSLADISALPVEFRPHEFDELGEGKVERRARVVRTFRQRCRSSRNISRIDAGDRDIHRDSLDADAGLRGGAASQQQRRDQDGILHGQILRAAADGSHTPEALTRDDATRRSIVS